MGQRLRFDGARRANSYVLMGPALVLMGQKLRFDGPRPTLGWSKAYAMMAQGLRLDGARPTL